MSAQRARLSVAPTPPPAPVLTNLFSDPRFLLPPLAPLTHQSAPLASPWTFGADVSIPLSEAGITAVDDLAHGDILYTSEYHAGDFSQLAYIINRGSISQTISVPASGYYRVYVSMVNAGAAYPELLFFHDHDLLGLYIDGERVWGYNNVSLAIPLDIYRGLLTRGTHEIRWQPDFTPLGFVGDGTRVPYFLYDAEVLWDGPPPVPDPDGPALPLRLSTPAGQMVRLTVAE